MKTPDNDLIKIPRAWLESLIRYAENYESAQGIAKDNRLHALLGYLSSAKTILKYAKPNF